MLEEFEVISARRTMVGQSLGRLSILKAKRAWRNSRHLVEAPAEVALVGKSSREGDVSERKLRARKQLLRTQQPSAHHVSVGRQTD